ncbi:uncharacterized protein PODANS_3_11597 [Podospora anserina S mat+]|uniref:Podospora anserina S mat+ genomic DNA chromosome 3, supercontig 3 n=2 Tax=Podospora TaxID=5144 RepID=B2ACS4_PODAN|nr:uncharacterized protein PODANS_3_11597 [Podospora anserina S mat+]KAK4683038.1 hypothetical protein QC764_311597 [Podospora pseudoanserina]CAP61239.1 unnamed protein product [Podospora anserina S mat+]CDP27594.1 Putative protein of unknown function [Podospora anserina S mat+]
MHYKTFYHSPEVIPVALLVLAQSVHCQQTTDSNGKATKLHWTGQRNFSDAPRYLEHTKGPWAALSVLSGTHDLSGLTKEQSVVPIWPSPWTNISEIWCSNLLFKEELSDAYRVNRSLILKPSSFNCPYQGGAKLPNWTMSIPSVAIGPNYAELFHAQVPIIALNESTLYLEPEITIRFTLGDILALGPSSEPGIRSIVQQLKDAGRLLSSSFGLYMGRPDWKLPSKMVLGGYEKSLINEGFIMFDVMDKPESVGEDYLFRISLKDVRLGCYDWKGHVFDWATTESPNTSAEAYI